MAISNVESSSISLCKAKSNHDMLTYISCEGFFLKIDMIYSYLASSIKFSVTRTISRILNDKTCPMEYHSLEEGELGGPFHSQALWLSAPIHEIQIYFASEL